MAEFEARERFTQAQVASLATSSSEALPHLVPVVFAVSSDVVYTALDTKKKSTRKLRRLANIEQNPRVALLVDHYSDDWDELWWVRADGVAEIHDRGLELATGFDLLRRKYHQYQRISLTGPVIKIAVDRWSSWRA
jgi:PPOX class probable F420-dependent enzyme